MEDKSTSYTVAEIEELREAVYADMERGRVSGDPFVYGNPELMKVAESKVRTYMLAGIRAKDFDRD